MPIQKKLIFISLFSAGISLFLAGIIIIMSELYTYRQEYIEENMVQAKIIGYNCSAALLFHDQKTAENILSALKNNSKVEYAAIYNNDWTLLAEYKKGRKRFDHSVSLSQGEGYTFGIENFSLIQSIIFDNEVIGKIAIQSELTSLYRVLLWRILLFSVVISGAFVLILFLVSRFQSMITKPIGDLVSLMHEISRNKNYSLHANKYGKDELGELALGFNEMLIQIRNRDIELEKYSRSLEGLVEERTSQLRASLEEKEVLLKEIHHRVKNNLQIISSLLNLQAGDIKDEQTSEMFRNSISRVKSMALIHEKLYQSKDLARIDFSEYAGGLIEYLLSAYQVQSNSIRVKIDIDNTFLPVNTAIPCGLIMNELISNSLKHAFPDGRKGEIRIRFCKEGAYTLTLSDDGIGFPESIDVHHATSLGLRLVNGLILQLGGFMKLNVEQGTEFQITFKVREKETS